MIPTTATKIKDLKVGDLFIISDGTFRVLSVGPNPGTPSMTEVRVAPKPGSHLTSYSTGHNALVQVIREGSVSPTHVVVDTLDGYTFDRDVNGPFTLVTATAFATEYNGYLKVPTYKVFAFTLVA